MSSSTVRDPQIQSWFASTEKRRVVFWTIVISLGFVQAWSHRLLVDHDGVAYLDIAENYARGAWSAALNGFYSPLYSWLIGIGFFLFKVPRPWESTLLHLVNFAGYLCAYACLEFLLGELIQNERSRFDSDETSVSLSENTWHTLGLGLFLYSSLSMANVSGQSGQGEPGSTPDIFIILFVFLATGLLLRMQSGKAGVGTYCCFGVALAFGYFAKTAMFPLSFVFLAVAGALSLRRARRSWHFLLAPVCFVLVAGPWVAILSHSKGRFAYGDAGTLTYRWLAGTHVNPVEWGGQVQDGETFVHPPRQLSTDPPVYEFAQPVPGTFPLWYGNSYWLEGWKFRFSKSGQRRTLHESYTNYWQILLYQKEFLVLLLILAFAQGASYFKGFLKRWALWVPAVAALAMYSLVRVEPRYVAAFLMLWWISLFAAVRLPGNDFTQRFVSYCVLATVVTAGLFLVKTTKSDFHTILHHTPSEQVQVADGILKLGIPEGQSLATIGIPRDSFYWARLARMRVISEIPTPNVNQYWFAPPETQEKVRFLFAQVGAVAIVTDTIPVEVNLPDTASTVSLTLPGWQRIGNTSYFFFSLRNISALQRLSTDDSTLHKK